MNIDSHNHWINEIRKYKPNLDTDEFIIKYSLGYTLQSLRKKEDMDRFRWRKKDMDGEKHKLKVITKHIVIGDIIDNKCNNCTPIEIFEKAVKLSKQKNFTVYTNNPQFVEALEVLCGENNIEIFRRIDGRDIEIDFQTAYNYLGDVYDIINCLRFDKQLKLGHDEDNCYYDEWETIEKEIIDYKRKWG